MYSHLQDSNFASNFRTKAEQALQAILLKFDTDVGTRATEVSEIEKESKSLKKKFEIWQNTIANPQKIE